MTDRKFTHPRDVDENHTGWITADGNEVRLYAWDDTVDDRIHGAIRRPDGWVPGTWSKTGALPFSGHFTLQDKPQTVTHWVCDYPDSCGIWWPDKTNALRAKDRNCLAIIRRETTGDKVEYFKEDV